MNLGTLNFYFLQKQKLVTDSGERLSQPWRQEIHENTMNLPWVLLFIVILSDGNAGRISFGFEGHVGMVWLQGSVAYKVPTRW